MTVVFFIAFIAALVGVFKPYINGLKRWHFGIAAIVSFFLIGVAASQDQPGKNEASTGTNTASTSADNSTAASNTETSEVSAPQSKWDYGNDKDEMRGTSSQRASLTSENTVDLGFPYGVVHGELWLRKRAEDGLNAAFQVENGQILCHSFSDSYVSIKFDNGSIRKYRCTDASDGSSEVAFIDDARGFLAAVRKSKRTVVEAEFYQKGQKQFTFDTAGLEWK